MPPNGPLKLREKGREGGPEINDTEAGFNKEGTEEEKKRRRTRGGVFSKAILGLQTTSMRNECE